jgi:hypothetical protein
MHINYRHYTTKAMAEMLAKEGVYYSRGDLVDRGRDHRPDVITLRFAEKAGKLSPAIIVDCQVYNNLEGVEETLLQNGFVRDEAGGKSSKQWTVAFHHAMDAGKLVSTVIATLDEALQDMPLMLYASPALKALADYHSFINSGLVKISYGDLMQHLGYWDERELAGAAAEVTDDDCEYMVAKYTRGRWAAWVSGDHIVPLFASEGEARRFLKDRALRVSWQRRPAIRVITSRKKGSLPNLYVLVDHTKNIEERLDWLRSEIDRLEGQAEAVRPQRRFASVVMKSACSR